MNKCDKACLLVILASSSLTVMAGLIMAPILNLMGEVLKVDPGSTCLIVTTHGIFVALCSPLMGMLIDRVGVRSPLIFGLVLYGLAGASGLFFTSYEILIISRVFLGIAVAAVFTSITVMILNLYDGAHRNKVMGWRGSSINIGSVAWPNIGQGK